LYQSQECFGKTAYITSGAESTFTNGWARGGAHRE